MWLCVLAMAALGAGWVSLIGLLVEPGGPAHAEDTPRAIPNDEPEGLKYAASCPEPSPLVPHDTAEPAPAADPVLAAPASSIDGPDPLETAALVCPTMAELFTSMAADLESQAVIDNARGALEENLSSDDAEVQKEALQTLAAAARLGDVEALATLQNAVASDDHNLRRRAVRALSTVDSDEVQNALAELTNDPDDGVRRQVARALSELPKELSGDLLVSMLGDPSDKVVEQALMGLGDLRYQTAHEEISGLIGARDTGVTIAAGRAMRKIGDPVETERARALVIEGLTDTDPEIRLESLRQIRDIGGEGALPYFETAARDADPTVRSTAQEILDRLAAK